MLPHPLTTSGAHSGSFCSWVESRSWWPEPPSARSSARRMRPCGRCSYDRAVTANHGAGPLGRAPDCGAVQALGVGVSPARTSALRHAGCGRWGRGSCGTLSCTLCAGLALSGAAAHWLVRGQAGARGAWVRGGGYSSSGAASARRRRDEAHGEQPRNKRCSCRVCGDVSARPRSSSPATDRAPGQPELHSVFRGEPLSLRRSATCVCVERRFLVPATLVCLCCPSRRPLLPSLAGALAAMRLLRLPRRAMPRRRRPRRRQHRRAVLPTRTKRRRSRCGHVRQPARVRRPRRRSPRNGSSTDRCSAIDEKG